MILVTGGTGLVGSHLLFDLISQGESVRALKRKNSNIEQVRVIFSYYSNNADALFQKIEWVDGDITDSFSLTDALVGISKVYHCSGLVSFKATDKQRLHEVNVLGTRNLVDASLQANIQKFCFVSSVATLGTPEQGETVVSENTPWCPESKHSNYSLSKFHSELEVWRGIAEGLNAVIINPSIILGAGFWNAGSSLLFSTVAKGLKYYTKGITGYVDVRDVAQIAITLMQSDISNQRFIVSAQNCSYEYIFKTIAQQLNIKAPYKYASKKLTNIGWRLASLQRIFGIQPNFTRETANASHNITHFDNTKIKEAIGFTFTPISASIAQIAKLYKTK